MEKPGHQQRAENKVAGRKKEREEETEEGGYVRRLKQQRRRRGQEKELDVGYKRKSQFKLYYLKFYK